MAALRAAITVLVFIDQTAASTFFQMIGKIAIFRYTRLALSQAKLKVKTFTGIVFHFANECILIGKTL